MAHPSRESEAAAGGLPLWARFALLITLALTGVMFFAGYALYSNGSEVAARAQEALLVRGLELSRQVAGLQADLDAIRAEIRGFQAVLETMRSSGQRPTEEVLALRDEVNQLIEQKSAERLKAEQKLEAFWRRADQEETPFGNGQAVRYAIEYGPAFGQRGYLYRARDEHGVGYDLYVPTEVNLAERGLLRLIVGSSVLVVLVGAGMSVFVAQQVSRPLELIVKDVQQISRGMLDHRVRAGTGREVRLLAQAINRMTRDLSEARQTELELSVREREMEVAGEVREALLPTSVPALPGFEVGAIHLSSAELGGDLHDYIDLEGGGLGLLVCDVSGKGLPGALVGATARSYLRAELARGGDVKEAFHLINRQLARDVRRGMYVSALYVRVDPANRRAQVVCAGHKLPLVRYAAQDGKVRVIHPDGIALGFDKGPIFERSLQVVDVAIEPGDRLVLSTTGAAVLANKKGEEYGEKQLYALIQRFGGQPGAEFLERVRTVLESYAQGVPPPRDISLVTISRA